MKTTMTTKETTFTTAQSLFADMQAFNTFRISHIKPADSHLESILTANVSLSDDHICFNRDFSSYGYRTGIKSAVKLDSTESTATYRVCKPDGWENYGVWTPESKWLTDDYIMVDAWNEEQNTEACEIEEFDLYSLCDPKYFDAERSYSSVKSNKYVVVIDLNKLGIMTDKQKHDYKKLVQDISKYAHGEYQTVAYIIDRDAKWDGLWDIGLYNLDSEDITEKYMIIPAEDYDWNEADACTKTLLKYGEDMLLI